MKVRLGTLVATLALAALTFGQVSGGPSKLSAKAESVLDSVGKLRSLPDDQRRVETKRLAKDIAALSVPSERLLAASMLANLSTEGDFGRDTLQAVTDTLVLAVKGADGPIDDFVFDQLAALNKYEGMTVDYSGKPFAAARKRLDDLDAKRSKVDFTLTDLNGKAWTLSQLKGHVVLVNFWATWCPPCRKEMPDIEELSKEFKDQGLVVLAISDEPKDTVEKFIKEKGYTYNILLDPGRKVAGEMYEVSGIPKNFIYDREGKLVAQSIDMRTRKQFLALLAKAGIHEKSR